MAALVRLNCVLSFPHDQWSIKVNCAINDGSSVNEVSLFPVTRNNLYLYDSHRQ